MVYGKYIPATYGIEELHKKHISYEPNSYRSQSPLAQELMYFDLS